MKIRTNQKNQIYNIYFTSMSDVKCGLISELNMKGYNNVYNSKNHYNILSHKRHIMCIGQ